VQILGHGEFTGTADYRCALLSLPLALRIELHGIPSRPAYLSADPLRIERWAARMGRASRLRVGIAWRGNPQAETGGLQGRSIDLRCFRSLLHVPGIDLISLQKNATAQELADAGMQWEITDFGESLDPGPDAFVDTAAIMASLDLVITADTSIAHLAGALGTAVWVGLHTTSDWRWLTERTDSPWYPSMRLFRQPSAGDWPSVFNDMVTELLCLAAACESSVALRGG
jgi:hypothetical protein